MADLAEVLGKHGGSATFADLRTLVSARAIRTGLATGQIRRVAKGVYSLPAAPSALTAAAQPRRRGVPSQRRTTLGTRSDRPAWSYHTSPCRRGQHRRLSRIPCTLHWAAVGPSWTAMNRQAPHGAGLCSHLAAVRGRPHGRGLGPACGRPRSRTSSSTPRPRLRGPHRRRILRVAALADGRAESVLGVRAPSSADRAGIEGFVPQVVVQDGTVLGAGGPRDTPGLRIGFEADGFAFTAPGRADAGLSSAGQPDPPGWRILRFSWEDVMFDGEWVVTAIRQATGLLRHHNVPEHSAVARVSGNWLGHDWIVMAWERPRDQTGRPR